MTEKLRENLILLLGVLLVVFAEFLSRWWNNTTIGETFPNFPFVFTLILILTILTVLWRVKVKSETIRTDEAIDRLSASINKLNEWLDKHNGKTDSN
jgi:hypothetical protein